MLRFSLRCLKRISAGIYVVPLEFMVRPANIMNGFSFFSWQIFFTYIYIYIGEIYNIYCLVILHAYMLFRDHTLLIYRKSMYIVIYICVCVCRQDYKNMKTNLGLCACWEKTLKPFDPRRWNSGQGGKVQPCSRQSKLEMKNIEMIMEIILECEFDS